MSFDWHRGVNFVSILFLLAGPCALAQSTGPAASAPSQVASRDYPEAPGVFVEGAGGWVELSAAIPSRSRVKRGVVATFTYGAVPTDFVAEYDGERAPVQQTAPGRPFVCIYGSISLPGASVLVRLHVNQKKGLRELDSGRMPIVGTKTAQAKQTDQVAVDVSQPEEAVWFIRPKENLLPGEYALMLGTRNVNVFPFGVAMQKRESASAPTR